MDWREKFIKQAANINMLGRMLTESVEAMHKTIGEARKDTTLEDPGAYEIAEQAMESVHNLLNDINQAFMGVMIRVGSTFPKDLLQAVASEEDAVASLSAAVSLVMPAQKGDTNVH